jgi:copper transport protein
LALAGLAVLAPAAGAHAILEATSPPSRAQLVNPPAEVSFRFSEPVTATPAAVKVFDAHGQEIQRGVAFHPGRRAPEVAVRVPFNLPDGGYTATYHVISADSHPIEGGLTFKLGRGASGRASVGALLRAQTTGTVTATALSAVRALQYAAIALGLGTIIFLLACWVPGLSATAGGDPAWAAASAAFASRARGLLLLAALAGALSALLALVLLAAEIEGTSFWTAARGQGGADVLGTRFGAVWAAGVGTWLAVGVAVVTLPSAVPALRPASVGATGLALRRGELPLRVLAVPLLALSLLPALTGHASVESPVVVLLPANVAHVIAMAAWLGGIAVLVLAFRAATARLQDLDRTRLLVAVVSRFSRLAGIAIAVLLLSGIVQGVVEVASIRALTETAFGRAVLLKILAFAAIVTLGWLNRSRSLPALRHEGGTSTRTVLLLRRALTAELALGIAVLGVTGALAGYAPSRTGPAVRPTAVTATAPAPGRPIIREVFLGPAHVKMRIAPARAGIVNVDLRVFDHALQPFTHAKELKITAALPAKRIPALELRTRAAGPSHYAAAGTLGIAGTWRLTVTLRVSKFDEYTSRVSVPIR